LKILGKDRDISTAQTELSTYETRLAAGDTPQLLSDIQGFRASLPKNITFGSTFVDYIIIEPDDITIDIVPVEKKESTYFMQEKAQVKATISSFVITDFSGAQTRYSLIKKEFKAKAPLSKFEIYEVIDKSVVDSVQDIKFDEQPTKIVKEDPVVKWFVPSMSTGATKNINYVVKTDFDVGIDKVKTIIASTEKEKKENITEEAECGDGVCTIPLEDKETCPEDCKAKFPWTSVLIIVLISIALLLYILFYRGKYSLRALTRGKTPFASKEQLKSVMNYITSSREKKINDEEIKKKLIEKGWKEEQIKFAFAELEWAKKEKAATKPTADIRPMQEYIKAALARGLSKDVILKKLVSQGWDEKLVKKELGLK